MNNRNKKILIILTAVFVIAVLVPLIPYSFGENGLEKEFKIEKGQSVSEIADNLKKQGIINDKNIFLAYSTLLRKNGKMKSGVYGIKSPESTYGLLQKFSGRGGSDDILVTVFEGQNISEIDKTISFYEFFEPGTLLRDFYLEEEGHLFPDSYYFSRGSNVTQIIQRLRDRFEEVAGGISNSDLIIASMLEKEVRTYEDMRIVSGIIRKRMQIGMPLQIDATVAYGACLPTWKKGNKCDVTKVNLVDNIKKDSAYNTYTRTGLPAGPISNPGSRAIEASLNPKETDYLFYLSKKDGTTVFSETASQHESARRKYILN